MKEEKQQEVRKEEFWKGKKGREKGKGKIEREEEEKNKSIYKGGEMRVEGGKNRLKKVGLLLQNFTKYNFRSLQLNQQQSIRSLLIMSASIHSLKQVGM